MEIKFDDSGHGLIGTLSGNEIFRLGRGDIVEFDAMIPHGNRLVLRCESPESLELIDDLKVRLCATERRCALLELDACRRTAGWKPDVNTRAFVVVIPTVGDSVARLAWLVRGLRSTIGGYKLTPEIVIADDGGGFESDKAAVADMLACKYVLNKGKHGIPGNLNSALANTNSDWLLVMDDGSVPSIDWLEAPMRTVSWLRSRSFGGRRVGMVGTSHIQDWMLKLSGQLERWPIDQWFYKPSAIVDSMWYYFSQTVECPHKLTWFDLNVPDSPLEYWPGEVQNFVRYNTNPVAIDADVLDDTVEAEVRRAKYLSDNRWQPGKLPGYRVNWSPGAQGLMLNREFLENVGGFGYDCVGYERLLACRAAETGWLSLFVDGAPYLHMPSLGFNESGMLGLTPKHREIYNVCMELYDEPEPNKVVRKYVSFKEEQELNGCLTME